MTATSRDPAARNPQRALELARKAVELEPDSSHYWNTLGVAQYRTGDFTASITSLSKSLKLDRDGAGFPSSALFLAMAHWQLGEREKARPWYDKAMRWMVEISPVDEELIRFREEAEQLMGLPEEDRSVLVEAKSADTEWPDLELAAARELVRRDPSQSERWNRWNQVALEYYRPRNWDGAEVDAGLAVELTSDKPNLMLSIVPLFLLAGKHDEYRQVCQRLMDRWQE